MRHWMALTLVLGLLGGIASPTFADMDAPRPMVPARGTEGPDISTKTGSASLMLTEPSTYPPVVRGVEGPEER